VEKANAQNRFGEPTQVIKEISIIGVERIEPETVLTYMDLRIGDEVSDSELNRILKSLYATGLFADVRLDQKDTLLEVTVIENPVISQIAFEGNDKLDNEELLAEIQLRPRQVFTRTKIQSDVNRLYQVYRRNGRFSVNIEPKVIKLDQNRINLVFEIDEGPVTKVRSIRFVGNKKYDDDKLQSEISTKEARWYSFFANNDRYDPDRLSFDQELLRRFYLSQGYADFRLISANAELSQDKEYFYLTITLEEGERYRVNDVVIDSKLRHFDAEVLKPFVTMSLGDWYDSTEVEKSVDQITDELGNLQYAFVNVRPDIQRNRENQEIDIIFHIQEAPKVFVERINIRGNVRTLDKVIRREMELVESDPFNRSKLAKSEQSISDLNFFEEATVSTLKGSAPDKTIIDVEVSEKSTGELSIGAGFSTNDGPLADVRITERNLLGKGQQLQLAATIAGERTEFDFAFNEPYFLNRDFLAGFDLFHSTRDFQDESSFDQRRTGGGIRFGYPLSDKWRQLIRYRIERNEVTDVRNEASRFIQDQEGKRITSAFSQRLTFDDRDSTLFPTDGRYAWIDAEFAGVGGDANYISGKVGGIYYYPVADGWVLSGLGEIGSIVGINDKDVKINERYFLGGSTLRGFEQAGVGPRDINTEDSLGGNNFYRGSVELSFPLGLPEELGIKGHSFTDFGTLWELDNVTGNGVEDENSIRASAGLGVSWRSPFGPVRVDFALPYAEEEFDVNETFRFSFGTRF
jgi:outer membrane protein insertion porin family